MTFSRLIVNRLFSFFLLSLCLFSFSASLIAQLPTYNFSWINGGHVIAVESNPNGGYVILGNWRGTQDLDPTLGGFSVSAGPYSSSYVASVDSMGSLNWIRTYVGSTSEIEPCDLKLDNAGNVYFSLFSDDETLDVDPTNEVLNIFNGVTHIGAAVIKLNQNGDLIWANRIVSGQGSIKPTRLTLDNNTVISTGYLGNGGGVSGGYIVYGENSVCNCSIPVIGNGGNTYGYMVSWSLDSGIAIPQSEGYSEVRGALPPIVSVDNDDSRLVFYHENGAGIGLGQLVRYQSGASDIIWVQNNIIDSNPSNSTGVDYYVSTLETDNMGNIYIAGALGTQSGVTGVINTEPITQFSTTFIGSKSTFVIKCSSLGYINKAFYLPGSNNLGPTAIPLDSDIMAVNANTGELVLFGGPANIDLDPSSSTFQITTASSSFSKFIAGYDSDLNFDFGFGYELAWPTTMFLNDIELSSNGKLFICGTMDNQLNDVDPGPVVAQLNTSIDWAGFLACYNFSDFDGDGITAEQGDCNDQDGNAGPASVELCNGLDDNCNNLIDETFDTDNDGYTTCQNDCNDNDLSVFPGASDIDDGIDNDCDLQIDENADADGDGVTPDEGDCNDNLPGANPGALELCNNEDDNCNGVVDEGFDFDQDMFTQCEGDCDDSNAAINPAMIDFNDNIDNNCDGSIDENTDDDGDGISQAEGDCNDTNPNISPDAAEVCDGMDNNCNDAVDEGFDSDADGYTLCEGDCNDALISVFPGANEVDDNLDNDCDGSIDEGFDEDADGDGYSLTDGDCDDNSASINPGEIELCNAIDDNCNSFIDEGFDVDNDGYTICENDCNDSDSAINPGAVEVDDSIDNNCDGVIDNDSSIDDDGDGLSEDEGDCDDTSISVGPDAPEVCNGLDDNCNQQVDEGLDCTEAPFFIPNGISPNGDGINDYWQLNGVEQYPECSVTVVNRWGQVVFESLGYAEPWRGYYQGELLPIGDYYYSIQLDAESVFTGFISIK
jgi:gliding motility-associated-like protein